MSLPWLILLLGSGVLLLLTIVFSTLKTGIPPMPSTGQARAELLRQVERLAAQEQGLTLIDLGSGWGHLVIPLARRFPQHQVIGYELSFFPWLVSLLLKKLLRLENLLVHRKDFLKADLSAADFLICYLMPLAMSHLTGHLQQQKSMPRWLISHFFALPGWQPMHQIELRDLYRSPIYVYCLEKQPQEFQNPCLKP